MISPTTTSSPATNSPNARMTCPAAKMPAVPARVEWDGSRGGHVQREPEEGRGQEQRGEDVELQRRADVDPWACAEMMTAKATLDASRTSIAQRGEQPGRGAAGGRRCIQRRIRSWTRPRGDLQDQVEPLRSRPSVPLDMANGERGVTTKEFRGDQRGAKVSQRTPGCPGGFRPSGRGRAVWVVAAV